MKITDGKRTIKIKMCIWEDGNGYTPDWSEDFFDAGNLKYDEDSDSYIVKDVNYCIDQANDWMNSTGDFSTDDPNSNRMVFFELED